MLAVQRALQQGRDHLQRGNFQSAVDVLESQVARIDGSRDYLDVLRDAYRGLIRELKQNNRTSELPTYLRRLEILDPGTVLDQQAGRAPAASVPAVAATRPTPEKPATPSLAQLAQARDGGPGRIARGVAAEVTREPADRTDPFHPANARVPIDAKGLLERAEVEFSKQHYDDAGRLFEQVNHLDPSLAWGSQERWAYCKIFGVASLLNRSGVTDQNASTVEQEVRLAMSMAPKLDDFGKKLLREIQARAARSALPDVASIEVRHTAARGQSWAVAETANFRIIHRQAPELAERVARGAEGTRTAMARRWFGDDSGTWSARCEIYLHATAQDYAQATGVRPESPGHSTIRSEGDRVLSRRIDLHCDNSNMFAGVLPHETTHVVLAGRFGEYQVPRWADEGMAVLAEPRERIELHLRNLPKHSQEQQLFSVAQLMRRNDYPEARLIGPFYAQSVSLVEYLSQEKGPRTFARFLHEGLRGGYEPALEKYYGIRGFHDLEARWQRYALGDSTSTPVAGRQNP
jgi:hypothetical protein